MTRKPTWLHNKRRVFRIAGAVALVWLGTGLEVRSQSEDPHRTRELAEQGHAPAQHNLGVMYARGQGVPQDFREALKWYRKAAEQGLAQSQYRLGMVYGWGHLGVAIDRRESAKWLRQAAEQGHAEAQLFLGSAYDLGRGVPEDDREAAMWFRKAAEQGHAKAQYSLSLRYAVGDGVPEDDREALKWLRRAAEKGHDDAQFSLGQRYSRGWGVPQDYAKAHAWFNRAAAQGNSSAARLRDEMVKKMTPSQLAEAQARPAEHSRRMEVGDALQARKNQQRAPQTTVQASMRGMRGQWVCGVPPDEAVVLTSQASNGGWVSWGPNGRIAMAPERSEQGALGGFADRASFVCEVEIKVGFRRRPARFYRLGWKMNRYRQTETTVYARDYDPRSLIVGVPNTAASSPGPQLSMSNDPSECTEVWWSNPDHSGEEYGYIVYKNSCARPVYFTVLKMESWARGRWQYGHSPRDGVEPGAVLYTDGVWPSGWEGALTWCAYFEGDYEQRCKPGRDSMEPRGLSWKGERPSKLGLQAALDQVGN